MLTIGGRVYFIVVVFVFVECNGVHTRTDGSDLGSLLASIRRNKPNSFRDSFHSQQMYPDVSHLKNSPDLDVNFILTPEGLTDANEDEINGMKYRGFETESKEAVIFSASDMLFLTHEQKVTLGLESETIGELKKIYIGKSKREFVNDATFLWNDAIIPYRFSSSKPFKSEDSILAIEKAIESFHKNSCIRWEPFTATLAETTGHYDFIEFVNGDGCSSFMGQIHRGKQEVSLQEDKCISPGKIEHEMGHTTGMFHEQNRSDRDKHLTVNYENIWKGKSNPQYIKEDTANYAPYDYNSGLHYAPWTFSQGGGDTMTTFDPDLQFLMGREIGLSYYDFMAINKVYKCADLCSPQTTCQNGGYPNHNCGCHCPPGLTGESCQTIDAACGKIIDILPGEERVVTSPEFPKKYPIGLQCIWVVRAPKGYRVQMKMEYFSIAEPTKSQDCYHWLEVRYNLIGQPGPRYCGTSLRNKIKSTTIYGESNILMLSFNSQFVQDSALARGFNATFQAIAIGCLSNPCFNGGSCSVYDDFEIKCECDDEFCGEFCEKVASVNVSCGFEDDESTCFLIQDDTDDFQWLRRSDSTPTDNTGPETAESGQYYRYIETSHPRVYGDAARLTSKPHFLAIPRCLRFSYHMYGLTVGSLTVYIQGSGTPKTEVWSRSGSRGNEWYRDEINIPSTDMLTIIIEGTRSYAWLGDIAIDSIVLSPGYCEEHPYTSLETKIAFTMNIKETITPVTTSSGETDASVTPTSIKTDTSLMSSGIETDTSVTSTGAETETLVTEIDTTVSDKIDTPLMLSSTQVDKTTVAITNSYIHVAKKNILKSNPTSLLTLLTSASYTTDITPIPTSPTKQEVFRCDFEKDICGIINWVWNVQWKLGYDMNTFYSLPASMKHPGNYSVGLFSIPYEMKMIEDYCISFYVRRPKSINLKCAEVEIATVTLNPQRLRKRVWSERDCTEHTWKRFQVNVNSSIPTYYVTFVALLEKNDVSDIQIDDISLVEGKC